MKRVTLTAIAAISLSLTIAGPAAAAPVPLDTTFSGDGRLSLNALGNDFAASVVTDGTRTYIVGGTTVESGKPRRFLVARYLENGHLDPTFAGDGTRTYDLGGSTVATDAVLMPDGQLLVVGRDESRSSAVILAKLRENGGLESSFAGDGVKRLRQSRDVDWPHVEVDSNGRPVVAWSAIENQRTLESVFRVARFRQSGSIDQTFANGIKTIDIGQANLLWDTAIDSQDRFYGVGFSNSLKYPNGALAVMQLTSASHEDTRRLNLWGRDGTFGVSVAVDDADRAVIAVTPTTDYGLGAVRLTESLRLDSTYGGGDGIVRKDCRCFTSTGVLTDDGLVVFGETLDNDSRSRADRFSPDGRIDGDFSGGIATWNLFGGDEHINAAVVDDQGRLLFAGFHGGRRSDATLARVLPGL